MNRYCFILLLIMLISTNCLSAQKYSIKERSTFKLSYSSFPQQLGHHSYMPFLRLEVNYGISKYIETGIYLGSGGFDDPNVNKGLVDLILMPVYGLNANIHLLPFLLDKKNFRFDVYATTKLGRNYCNSQKVTFRSKNHLLEYGVGVGATYYISKKFGLFAEYSFGNYYYTDYKDFFYKRFNPHTNLRYGLSMRFIKN